MGENIRLHWGVSRVWAPTLDLLEDEERRFLDISVLQASILRQMAFPWARMSTRLVEDHGDYQTTVEMPEAYLDALDELELMLGGGYTPPEEVEMGDLFVDRGDPNANDFAIGTGLIADGAWHGLDLSGIINNELATRVLIRGYAKDNLVGSVCSFRRYPNQNAYNAASHATQVANVYVYFQCQVVLSPAQWVDYLLTNGMDVAAVVVQGWWVPTYGYGA